MAKPSIKSVAKRAGVSIATVSRFMNNPELVKSATREKVEEAVRLTGYTPNELARQFRRGRTHVITVVVPTIGSSFFSEVVDGIQEAAATKGYSIILIESRMNTLRADELIGMIVSRQTDGVILLASVSPFGLKELGSESERTIPIVVGCEVVTQGMAEIPSVRIDNVAAAEEVTRYLASRGHRRIGLMTGLAESLLTADREAGFRNAMQAAGLPIEEGWILNGDLTIDGAISATRRLLSHAQPPTAIFCTTDDMAMGCLHALKTRGLPVPEDVSVVGFDDTPQAAVMDPPLTTISQPRREIGERALYRLCREIDNVGSDKAPLDLEPELLPYGFVIRQSVADAAQQFPES